jgi:hypothetical protein
MDSVPEVWKPIPGFDIYEASSLGRVRSVDRINQQWNRYAMCQTHVKGKVLKSRMDRGYLVIGLKKGNGSHVFTSVHRLVALAFIGPCPDKYTVDHLNEDKCDNRPENLEYVTRGENTKRAYRSGQACTKGERNPKAVLTEYQAQVILDLPTLGEALEYSRSIPGCNDGIAVRLRKRETWKHLVPSNFKSGEA